MVKLRNPTNMVWLSGIIIIWLYPLALQACRCVSYPTVEEAFERSASVFKGVLLSISEDINTNFEISATFQVMEVWKGVGLLGSKLPFETTVYTSKTSCGILSWSNPDNIGEQYLIYTKQHGMDTLQSVDLCTRTAISIDESTREEEQQIRFAALDYSFEECYNPPVTGAECKSKIKFTRPDLKVQLKPKRDKSGKSIARLNRVIVYVETKDETKVKSAIVAAIPIVG